MKRITTTTIAASALLVMGLTAVFTANATRPAGKEKAKPVAASKKAQIDRGRYIIATAGCNDCHTPGYMVNGGTTPESEWMTGSGGLGFKGPWGTSYPYNLRKFITGMTESEWINVARNVKGLPPMPWWSLRDMSDDDLKAVYAYAVHLGPKGDAAPAALPPGVEPTTPFVNFDVVMPAKASN
jgi:mono/diheme cytochrome c family protein